VDRDCPHKTTSVYMRNLRIIQSYTRVDVPGRWTGGSILPIPYPNGCVCAGADAVSSRQKEGMEPRERGTTTQHPSFDGGGGGCAFQSESSGWCGRWKGQALAQARRAGPSQPRTDAPTPNVAAKLAAPATLPTVATMARGRRPARDPRTATRQLNRPSTTTKGRSRMGPPPGMPPILVESRFSYPATIQPSYFAHRRMSGSRRRTSSSRPARVAG